MSNKYSESGVNIEKGYESVERIKKHVKRTENNGVMGGIGNFGGLFDLGKYNIKHPILISGTDGVGTKLLLAQELNKHDTIGIDLVAMCVNDVICVGAKPLFFLDYIAVGKNEPKNIELIVQGIADGCVEAGCALIGGETAEMPDMYQGSHYDLAGYVTGVVEKEEMLDRNNVCVDDVLIGLESSGIHSNGYSLVRKVFFKDNPYTLDSYFEELGTTLKEELLKPTRIYVESVLETIKECHVKSISHITGGGFIENIPRALRDDQGVIIYEKDLPKKPIFSIIEDLGNIDHMEMYNVFNMGIGMILIVDKESQEKALKRLKGYNPRVIGKVTDSKKVVIVP